MNFSDFYVGYFSFTLIYTGMFYLLSETEDSYRLIVIFLVFLERLFLLREKEDFIELFELMEKLDLKACFIQQLLL